MNKGYIAISTSLVLSILVMAVAVALGSANLMTRFNAADFNNKQLSFAIARSCLNYSLMKLGENINYAGNQTINISSYQCTIRPILTSGPNKIIEARAQINGPTTNLRLTVTGSTLSTVSLEEVVKF